MVPSIPTDVRGADQYQITRFTELLQQSAGTYITGATWKLAATRVRQSCGMGGSTTAIMGSRRTLKLGLAGDTMLGRSVGEVLSHVRPPYPHALRGAPPDGQAGPATKRSSPIFSDEVVGLVHEADLVFVNLECCISDHHERWHNPHKAFFFRAPPAAVNELVTLGVDAVTLGNNHALDYDIKGLEDTLNHLDAVGIKWTGAGRNTDDARKPVILEKANFKIGILGMTDHPEEFKATQFRPGVAYVDLQRREEESGLGPLVPPWVREAIRKLREEDKVDAVVVSPHWGPNMCPEPLLYVREAAESLMHMGVDLIAGHSAHNFQGVWGSRKVIFDMGDFVDDYARDEDLRNDLGMFFIVHWDLDTKKPYLVEAVPLKLEFCYTELAQGNDYKEAVRLFVHYSKKLGTPVTEQNGRLYITLEEPGRERE